MRMLSALICVSALLAACGDEARAPRVEPERVVDGAVTPDPSEASGLWSLVSSDEGVALRLEDDGELIASLACRGRPARLEAATDRFDPIMSEDRFSVGVGDEVFALAADLEAGRARGVEASGDIPGELLDRLEHGGAIAFNYGAQNQGPFPAVGQPDLGVFARYCRTLAP